MNGITITSAKYADSDNALIKAIIDGEELFVPLDPANRHYAAIL